MATPYQPREIPKPQVSSETRPFWDAVAANKLLLKHCSDCREWHYFPRAVCPHCGSPDVHWVASARTGTIYSVTVTRRGTPVPYALAYVTLEEGVTIMTNMVDCDLDALKIGQEVELVIKPTSEGGVVPMFKPLDVG